MFSFKALNDTGESQLLKGSYSLQNTRVQLAVGLTEQAQPFIAGKRPLCSQCTELAMPQPGWRLRDGLEPRSGSQPGLRGLHLRRPR